jgi:serine/threonine protein phosphatase PrpC
LTSEWIICANAGDSRSVISRLGNKAVPLSYDHKPDDEPEERRIRAAGGYVAGGRVEGDLAVSRGLGDFRFKSLPVVMQVPFSGIQPQENGDAAMDGGDHGARRPAVVTKPGEQKVSPVPDIIVQTRNATQDEFLIVACDGIWDVQTNYEAVQSVAEIFKEGESNLGLVCEEVRT